MLFRHIDAGRAAVASIRCFNSHSMSRLVLYIHRHQADIDNFVNSQRIFKILSLVHSVENLR